MLSIGKWTKQRWGDDAQFPPLQFQRIFERPDAFLTATGWSRHDAQLIGATICYYYSIWVSQQNHDGTDYYDRYFSCSIFGEALHNICSIPYNEALSVLWFELPLGCTVRWVKALCNIFKMFPRFCQPTNRWAAWQGHSDFQLLCSCSRSFLGGRYHIECSKYRN